METLVAFSQYYLAVDPCTQGRTENFYRKALERYEEFTYKEFHKYIARKMAVFNVRHGFPKTKADKQGPDESEETEVCYVVVVKEGAEINKSYAMSDDEDDEDGAGSCAAAGAAADADGEAAAAATTRAAPEAAAAAAQAAQA